MVRFEINWGEIVATVMGMASFKGLTRVRSWSCWGMTPLPVWTSTLIQTQDLYYIEQDEQRGRSHKCSRTEVPALEVNRQFDRLRAATVPAYPVSPMVCDGGYMELLISADRANLAFGWWSGVPAGAEVVTDFAQWLMTAGSRK